MHVTHNPSEALQSRYYDGPHFTMEKQAHGGQGTYRNNMASKQICVVIHICLTLKSASYDLILSPGGLSPHLLVPGPELVPLTLK